MLLVHNLRLPLDAPVEDAFAAARRKAGLPPAAVAAAHLHKVSVDARHAGGSGPTLVYSVALTLTDPGREPEYHKPPDIRAVQTQPLAIRPGAQPLPGPVVVCGLGPAGLFAALELAVAGYAPLVLERGPDMARRRAAVQAFEQGGALDRDANIQFGEGGAGTFSDGKLTSRIGDGLCARVTERLLAAGAPENIAWLAKPHIGTDRLRGVFAALRKQLEALGGRVLFNTRLTGLALQGGKLAGLRTTAGELPCGALVLACGHSARDTFADLARDGVEFSPKSFSVGFRIEHLQSDIDRGLYHGAAGHPALPPGEYQLSARVGGRGVYTFCMCPGGSVVAAASEDGGVVTNGMSLHARGGPNANVAVVAGVSPADFEAGPFGGVVFQQQLERAAFRAGGGDYTAPAQTVGAFLQGRAALELDTVQPTYPRGVAACDLGSLLPTDIAGALRGGLAAFGRKLPGYAAPGAVLTGLETRTSSPVRIARGEDGECLSLPGLWPCGEGPGHAGGIMSAAVDGIRTAHAIIGRYAPG